MVGFSAKIRTMQGYLLSPLLSNIILDILANTTRQDKKRGERYTEW